MQDSLGNLVGFVSSVPGRIVDASGEEKIGRELQRGGALNVKRYIRREVDSAGWRSRDAENPYWILDTVEMKTAWHPIGV